MAHNPYEFLTDEIILVIFLNGLAKVLHRRGLFWCVRLHLRSLLTKYFLLGGLPLTSIRHFSAYALDTYLSRLVRNFLYTIAQVSQSCQKQNSVPRSWLLNVILAGWEEGERLPSSSLAISSEISWSYSKCNFSDMDLDTCPLSLDALVAPSYC